MTTPRTLGVIVARGQSKRLPGKILKPLLGEPLLNHMARSALASKLDRVILSTDDDDIAAAAARVGLHAPFKRPAKLATDFVCNDDVVLHALEWIEANEPGGYDAVVLLQPTAPFIRPEHIDACVNGLSDPTIACCFTVTKATQPPEWMFVRDDDGTARLLLDGSLTGTRQHTQKLGEHFVPSGGVWAMRAATLRTAGHIYTPPLRMVEIDHRYAVDIDEPIDLVVAEAVGRHYNLGSAAAP